MDTSNQTLGPLSSTTVTSGRTFTTSDAKGKVVVLDKGYAKQKSLKVGSTVKISSTKFTVVGINSSASAVANMYIPLYWGQKLSGNKGKVNQIYVRATSSTQIAKVKAEIKKALPGATVTTSQDLAKQVSGSLSSASTLANRLGRWLAIAALVAAVAVASLLTLSTVSRRVREFGTLKAIGWRSRRVVGQVVGEALVQGIAGGIVGVGLGYACTKLISHFAPSLQATVGSTGQSSSGGGGFPGGGGSGGPGAAFRSLTHTVTVALKAPMSLSLLALAIGLAICAGLIAGGLGGWRASRLSPADALRRVD